MAADERPDHEFQDLQVAPTRGFLPILWQRKALVILGIILGLTGGFLVYWQRSPVYQSSALVLVIKKNSQPLAVRDDPRSSLFEDFMATHVVLLRSPLIVEKAVKKKDLASFRTFENSPDPVASILSSLTVTRDIKEIAGGTGGGANNIVYLAYRGPVADECGKIVTAIIESYQEFLDVKYRNVSDQTLDLITKARDVLKKDLAQAESNFRQFRNKHPLLIRNKDGGNLTTDRMSEIEKERTFLMIRMEKLKKRIDALDEAIIQGKGGDTLIALMRSAETKVAVNSPEKVLGDQLLPLRAKEQELLTSLDEGHPSVKSIRAHIALIEEHHKQTGLPDTAASKEKDPAKQYLALMQAEFKELDVVFKSLGTLLDTFKSEAKELSSYELEEEQLRNEEMRNKALYDSILKRLQEINLVRDSGGFDASPLAHSGVGVKVAPSAFQMIMGGLMLGLLCGIGLAFLADLTDKGFRSPDEVRRRLNLPMLGHVPFLRPDPEMTRKIEAGEIATDPLLYALYRSKSLEAEAYRAVRTTLLFTIQGEGHRVIQITSPNKGDGKSLLASNLAISVAQAEKRVLLIDADLRRPRQHKVFAVPNTQGLVNIIRQESPWQACVQKTPQEGLAILTSGSVPHNPAELLTSPQFKQLLESARREYDLVIVDTPPLLAVTDPCIVAGLLDGVVLTLRLSRVGRPQAERACEIMKSLHVNVFGIVVNGVTRQAEAGLYRSGQYDYTESYAENENAGQEDDYYHHFDDAPSSQQESAPQEVEASALTKKPNRGLLSRIFSRNS